VHRGGGIALASSWMECGGSISECTARSERPFGPHGTRNLVSVVNRFDFLHRVVVSAISSPMAIGSKRRQRCITKASAKVVRKLEGAPDEFIGEVVTPGRSILN
jgi:hypothetical protein